MVNGMYQDTSDMLHRRSVMTKSVERLFSLKMKEAGAIAGEREKEVTVSLRKEPSDIVISRPAGTGDSAPER